MTFTEQKYEHFMSINRFFSEYIYELLYLKWFLLKKCELLNKNIFLLNTNIMNYLIQNDANKDCNNSATIARYAWTVRKVRNIIAWHFSFPCRFSQPVGLRETMGLETKIGTK